MSDAASVPTTEVAGVEEFFAVPLSTFVPKTQLTFDLYSQIQGRYILVRDSKRIYQNEERSALQALGERDFYVRTEQRQHYISYLEEQLTRLLHDPEANSEDRASNCYDVGTVVSRHALRDPSSAQVMRMAQDVIDTTISMMCEKDATFTNFINCMQEDADLYEHSMHVCLYGIGLARCLGETGAERLAELGLALLFHDVGKVALDDSYLNKSTPLTEDEWIEVYEHPLRGWERVADLDGFGELARDVINNHHERLDGSGYPRGLRAEQISKEARIAAIVNAFDSHTTRRSHRPATNSCHALTEMLQQKGAYDRAMLTSFVKLLAGQPV